MCHRLLRRDGQKRHAEHKLCYFNLNVSDVCVCCAGRGAFISVTSVNCDHV